METKPRACCLYFHEEPRPEMSDHQFPASPDQPLTRVTLIGVPTDVGATRLGASLGPDALRVAQLGPALKRFGVDVRDMGNLAGPPKPQGARDPQAQGLRNRDYIIIWNQAAHEDVHSQ